MNKIYCLLNLLCFFCISNSGRTQIPAYNLTAKNFSLNCGAYTSLEFDLILQHTNSPVEFIYAGGQYFLSFNPVIANDGELSVSVIDSELPSSLQPLNPEIIFDSASSGKLIKLGLNVFPGAGNGYNLTGNYFPGLKIARIRLKTTSTSFSGDGEQIALQFRNPPVNISVTRIYAFSNDSISEITTAQTHSIERNNCGNHMLEPTLMPWDCCDAKLLSLNLSPEAVYDTLNGNQRRKDTITVELHAAEYPHELRYVSKCRIDSVNFSSFHVYTFFWLPPQSFYIVLKHFNSIETWSNVPVSLYREGIILNYDFTSSSEAAFGSNQTFKGGKYCLYSGDVDQNGIIDGSDLAEIENEKYKNNSGNYVSCDLNADKKVNLQDFQIADYNAEKFIAVSKPEFTAPDYVKSIHSLNQ